MLSKKADIVLDRASSDRFSMHGEMNVSIFKNADFLTEFCTYI